jgi:hypothetical protein
VRHLVPLVSSDTQLAKAVFGKLIPTLIQPKRFMRRYSSLLATVAREFVGATDANVVYSILVGLRQLLERWSREDGGPEFNAPQETDATNLSKPPSVSRELIRWTDDLILKGLILSPSPLSDDLGNSSVIYMGALDFYFAVARLQLAISPELRTVVSVALVVTSCDSGPRVPIVGGVSTSSLNPHGNIVVV